MVKPARWMDTLSLIFSLAVVAITTGWMVHNGAFKFNIIQDEKIVWHLVRSSGITAYILMTASVIWGLAISSKVVKDWSPGVLSMTLHSAISWLAVLFAGFHAFLLLFDDYFTYRIFDLLIPFIGPYRPLAVGLGTLTFWIMVVVSLSFKFKKRLGHKLWKKIHYASYAGFWMVTAHGLTAGTDGKLLGFRILLSGSALLTVMLLGYKIGTSGSGAKKPAAHAKAAGAAPADKGAVKRTPAKAASTPPPASAPSD
ncbi:MAG: ferric reductase-like transmembrane domain-containing protein [Anaerolineales bacterium]|nr:ferric reductase-like transmembrane domain-containing protein [Anaerolineales bacterium]